MKKFYDWIWEVLPVIWGFLWISVITLGSLAVLIAVVKWLLMLMGVM